MGLEDGKYIFNHHFLLRSLPHVRFADRDSSAGFRYPSERLTRTQALKGMTLDAAYASFKENEIGNLQVGKKADFVVLDTDIMIERPHEEREHEHEEGGWRGKEILDTKVLATVIDGKLVYGAI